MALPKIDQPIFELEIPSTKKRVKCRPFLVKEEKILLMGLQGGDNQSISTALKQIIQNCSIDPINVEQLASFDLEYFFLKLRSKSIAESVDLKYGCTNTECNHPIEFSVDLNNIEAKHSEGHTNKIQLTSSVGLIMKYPTFELIQKLAAKDENNSVYDLVINCIDQIYDDSNVYDAKDSTKEELTEWVESLDQASFMKMKNFFETMPKIQYETELECPKCKGKEKVTIEGLQNFFR